MRVVHMSSAHRADDVRILVKECRSLARAGYDVEFIVPGERSGETDGVKIVPVERRLGRLGRMFRTTVDVGIEALRRKADIYHFHDPELIPVALILRALGKRVIYDVHEDVPRSLLYRYWLPLPVRALVALVAGCTEWIAGRALSGIAAATPVIARRFPPNRTVLIQNFPLQSELMISQRLSSAKRRSVVYIGSVTATRGAFEMVRALAELRRYPDVRLVIGGEVSPPSLLEDLAALPGWQRVNYLGFQNREGVRNVLSAAQVGIVVLQATKAYVASQPVKLFEYMAAGIPVIASDFPLWRKWVVQHGCGLCVPPSDIAAIASAIEWMFEHPDEAARMGQKGRALVLDNLNWEAEEKQLLQLYRRLV